MTEDLLTVTEVAEKLKVPRSTIYRLVAREQLRAMKIGKRSIRFRISDIILFENRCLTDVRPEFRSNATNHHPR